MAVKMYYGTCSTAAATGVKEVYVRDIDLTENNFEFQRGDALSVYFTNTNTNANPSLKIMVGDPESEVSISDDSGKLVKTRSIAVDAVGAWDNGETVIFVYTYNASGTDDNNYYWELVNGAPSTESVYGVVKLEGNENTNVKTWLQQSSDKDYTAALAPGLLKKFYNVLQTDSSSMFTLTWTQGKSGTDLLTLGTLKVNDDNNNAVQIKYPLQPLIQEIVDARILSTDQIINNGEGNSLPNSRIDGQFYITNVLPSNKTTLYYKNGNTNWPFIDANTSNQNLHLRGKQGITFNVDNGSGGIAGIGVGTVFCRPKFIAQGNLQVDGSTTAKGITCTNLTLNGSGVVGGLLDVKGNLKGKTLYEDGILLKNKYSGKLKVVVKTTPNMTVGKKTASGHTYMNLKETGWTAIGVIGWNINEAVVGSGDGSHCYLWESIVFVGEQRLMYAFRNVSDVARKINCNFRVLYVKDI